MKKHPEYTGSYIPTLDGWRAIAISLVIFSHLYDSLRNALHHFGIELVAKDVEYIGLFGVQIFFGLSGFLITNRMLNDERAR